jgi:hypothetical protein
MDQDMSIDKAIALPLYRTRPTSLVLARMVHDTLGFVMYNKGTKDITNIKAVLEVNQINASNVETKFFRDSIAIDKIEAFSAAKNADTLYVRKAFKPGKDLTKGDYIVRWSLKTLGKSGKDTLVDNFPSDNVAVGYFQVSDSILAVGSIGDNMDIIKYLKDGALVNDTVRYKNAPSFYGFLTGNSSKKIKEVYKTCNVYENDYAKGLSMTSLSFWAKRNAKDSLLNAKVTVSAELWSPSVTSIYDPNYAILKSQLLLLDSVNYTIKSFNGKAPKRIIDNINVKFKKPIKLEDNAKYLVCVSTTDSLLGLAIARTSVSTKWSQLYNGRYISPIYTNANDATKTTGEWFYPGIGYDYYNALAVKIEGKSTSSLEQNDVTSNLYVYPNPSSNGSFKFASSTGSLSVHVTDLSGKVVYNFENKNHNALTHTIELEDVATGMYVARIVNNGEMSIVKLQVSK